MANVGSNDRLGPDGKLHADGYFTWHRRDGYVLDAKLPAEFVLAEKARGELDRLNSESLDLALLVGRLIRRMRAARDGRGLAAGDDALEQQALGYLKRKGLTRCADICRALSQEAGHIEMSYPTLEGDCGYDCARADEA